MFDSVFLWEVPMGPVSSMLTKLLQYIYRGGSLLISVNKFLRILKYLEMIIHQHSKAYYNYTFINLNESIIWKYIIMMYNISIFHCLATCSKGEKFLSVVQRFWLKERITSWPEEQLNKWEWQTFSVRLISMCCSCWWSVREMAIHSPWFDVYLMKCLSPYISHWFIKRLIQCCCAFSGLGSN